VFETAAAAVRDGMRRVNRAPAILAGLWFVTAALSVPLTLGVRDAIQAHLGGSLEADAAASGVNYDWMQEFTGQATGVAQTFGPRVIGFAAVVDNLSTFVDNESRSVLITSAAVLYVVLLTFLAGGTIDRLARDRPVRAYGFFMACGLFFFRFVRLGAIAALAYLLLFGYFHPWLFESVFPSLTRETTVERTAFLIRLALYAAFAVPLAGVNLLFDYAKVRVVVEDRRSVIGALSAAAGFVSRHPGSVLLVYLLDVIAFAGVLALYSVLAPGVGSAGMSIWFAFVVGQLYVAARLWVKLLFWASETALFQSRLAHAGYVRPAAPAWPESAAAEAIAR
jgi:hypothetical protein